MSRNRKTKFAPRLALLAALLGAVPALAVELTTEPAAEPAAAAAPAPAAPAAAPAPGPAPAPGDKKPPEMSPGAQLTKHDDKAFRPGPSYADKPYDVKAQEAIYGAKHLNPTTRPWVEWGRALYDRGAYPPSPTWFGEKNPASPNFRVYGDWRTAVAYNDNGKPNAKGVTDQSTIATRLNLDMDLGLTATERIHAFVRPLDHDGQFTRYDLGGQNKGFEKAFDFNLETLFFEGDAGAIAMGLTGRENGVDLPFTFGMIPLFTQNGIWLNAGFVGGAFSLAAKNSRTLDVSNYDVTFFTGLDKVPTAAALAAGRKPTDHDAKVFGFTGFADANRGYWEFGYGYVDAQFGGLSYHNATVAFSRRYGSLISNSVRVIENFGQHPDPGQAKTANGTLVLIENSLVTSNPTALVPYFNLFGGFGTPQALARAAGTGGVLVNTGINLESDGLTGFPTLDDTARDSWGGALGVEYLFNLDRQIVVEVATVQRTKDRDFATGNQHAIGVRFQNPLNNSWILRFDAMKGFRDDGRDASGLPTPVKDIFGVRLEIRHKF
ncbi:MAG TPA: hypothetical protein VOA87_03760 [Thermoanaerobaculia bacterium]|nr:hypothetical protein [Thermoanaerobaculia bacterium]